MRTEYIFPTVLIALDVGTPEEQFERWKASWKAKGVNKYIGGHGK